MPEGGIEAKNKVVLGYWDSTNLYVLCVMTGGRCQFNVAVDDTGSAVKFDGVSAKGMAIFDMEGDVGSITFKQYQVSTSWLGYSTDTTEKIGLISGSSVKFRLDQSDYATWGTPTLALAGVKHSFSPAESTTVAPIKFFIGDSTTPTDVNPIIIPTQFYNNCNKSTCTYTDGSQTAVLMTYCTLKSKPGQGTCTSIPAVGWTTMTDAQSDHPYSYCGVGQYCQTNCKATCQTKSTQCNYNTKTGSFGCTIGGTGLTPTTFWKTTWFLILMIAIGFVALVAVIVAIYWIFFHGKPKKSDAGYNVIQKKDTKEKKDKK